jgi:hypothetical protein
MDMTTAPQYRWPTKIRKFQISDPFLMLLVSKYENEIPWQKIVRNQEDLVAFVTSSMLPRQLARIEYPPVQGVKHCFVSERDVDLELALTTDQELDREDIEIIRLIRDMDGAGAATAALVDVINNRKRIAFADWRGLLDRGYQSDPGFCVLLLRPLLEMAGAGSRRTIIPPDPAVVDWLYRRCKSGRLSPNDNIAKMYAWKLGAGSQRVPVNGWQYIPSGPEHAQQLAAAAAGSGWCVASLHWGSNYLRDSCFYVLRAEGRPVVALRASIDGRTVVECQGRSNSAPAGWFIDIDLFIRSQGIELWHREREMAKALQEAGDPLAQSPEWWAERFKYWPFATQLAPEGSQAKRSRVGAHDLAPYLGFPCVAALLESSGLSFGAAEWAAMVGIDPARFGHVPIQYQGDQAVRDACVQAWTERTRDGELLVSEIEGLPAFVRQSVEFVAAVQANVGKDLRARVRRPPRTAEERLARFQLDRVLPPSENDSYQLAVERAVNALLTYESYDFSDSVFTAGIRSREDFPRLREHAWREAIEAHPPLWFALPEDLKATAPFQLEKGPVSRVDLDGWVAKVQAQPSLLTQQSTVPKSVRRHERILEAYFWSWLDLLRVTPYRIWVKRGLYRRVYMSYGVLADPRFLGEFSEIWAQHRERLFTAWSRGSYRMRHMALFQVAALRCLGQLKPVNMTSEELKFCLDVAELQRGVPEENREEPLVKEVRSRLMGMGLVVRG